VPNGGATGSAGFAASAGRPGTSAAAGSGGAGAGTSGAAGSSDAGGAVTTLTFDVTTAAVGGRYKPKNIGAVWIQNDSGKLVKSLEVWAGVRRRWLTRYVGVLSGATVDVTASATLSNHRAHHATWNLKDKSGAPVPPGKYTLVMELTDGDMTGRFNSIEFDTSAGPQSLSPTDAPSFTTMQLELK
jgi:hypothetical protein